MINNKNILFISISILGISSIVSCSFFSKPSFSMTDYHATIYSEGLFEKSPAALYIEMPLDSIRDRGTLRCGAYDNSPDSTQRVPSNQNLRIRFPGNSKIKTVFHVVHDSNGLGKLSSSTIQRQVDSLEVAFAALGFEFDYTVSYIENDLYFNSGLNSNNVEDSLALAMKIENSQAPINTLNIYSNNTRNALGYAFFPWEKGVNTYEDGVVVYFESFPGGNATRYDEGNTLVHEIGHYMGLWHTFKNGCQKDGDKVSDTPAHAIETSGCPIEEDTCPQISGKDPIDNYMNYSDDKCMNKFTPGQFVRMKWAISKYRKAMIELTPPNSPTPAIFEFSK